jgi:hypothetical protein
MRQLLQYIQSKTDDFRERPLFAYLGDTGVPPEIRLRFAPYVSHFVMTIADLWPLFAEHPPKDGLQELVNDHVEQEENHCEWFLSDLTSLELDPKIRFTDAIRFIWGDACAKSRLVSYEICRLLQGATALHKLVIIYSIEGTARTSFEAAVTAARQLETASGRGLSYMGPRHLNAELHHTVEAGATRQSLESLSIPESMRVELHAVVDKIFFHFTQFVDEVFVAANNGIVGPSGPLSNIAS